ncbi:aldose epimerase [Pedobacter yulinensis]|uniref:Aldose epimerase n=1 Tax=Pedobacter yulinensis TaxID=2126353 RepID=A0A2T3HRP4_9SPHI|nr:aldose 1-epimerase family protein [Pedobacter yulinensis]PST85073.1 aldose epimerase [Pedobacter yulinensis]
MIKIENDQLTAHFSEKGAELQRLGSKPTGHEYLWNGNPAFWGKYSPILFPIVGGLENDTYTYQNKEYHLSRHGFARDLVFAPKLIGDTEVAFSLSENGETLARYPFRFNLTIRYRLDGPALHCTYEVENPNQHAELLFSAGGHPAFSVPTSKDLAYSDYFLEFNGDEVLSYHKIADNLISDEVVTLKLEDRKLPLSHSLFYDDALVFKTLESNEITLKNHKNELGLRFRFDSFPYFGIWSAPDADFVCLEPWCGIADSVSHTGRLEDKEGIVRLAALQAWTRTWSVTCF